ncbi:hypothetical protein L227DRAFT_581111 [Lentinus tigrinus ALCF2SS1-6]|uniref:Uncharacterized protein n=1 Tax=Lentinus tigrinus ALCF2SS1-6 TaxID=1328759 RepID=A0A5C2RRJ5_9APHY|nr:hypothetical protein L227DRAFT_581111 [Lentinus tigrinus ALCF2SS1-6]
MAREHRRKAFSRVICVAGPISARRIQSRISSSPCVLAHRAPFPPTPPTTFASKPDRPLVLPVAAPPTAPPSDATAYLHRDSHRHPLGCPCHIPRRFTPPSADHFTAPGHRGTAFHPLSLRHMYGELLCTSLCSPPTFPAPRKKGTNLSIPAAQLPIL